MLTTEDSTFHSLCIVQAPLQWSVYGGNLNVCIILQIGFCHCYLMAPLYIKNKFRSMIFKFYGKILLILYLTDGCTRERWLYILGRQLTKVLGQVLLRECPWTQWTQTGLGISPHSSFLLTLIQFFGVRTDPTKIEIITLHWRKVICRNLFTL